MELLLVLALLWVLPIFVAHSMGKPKHRAGALYGIFLGWLGVIVLALLPPGKPLTLEELERRRPNVDPKWYERKRSELLAEQEAQTRS
jgi:hypothetical protein